VRICTLEFFRILLSGLGEGRCGHQSGSIDTWGNSCRDASYCNLQQGMCRSLVNVIEELLILFMVEKLMITAIPNIVETWTKLVQEAEGRTPNKINLMVFPGTVLLSKPLYQSQKTDGETPP
ncbi:hypothetical protein J1N35_034854, partial [Gossypium stocksii]